MVSFSEQNVESWDDDGDLEGFGDLQLRNVSSTTTATYSSSRGPNHRDSISSRYSAKSDMEDERDFQVQLPTGDDISTMDTIAIAKSRGIPLPANIPASALREGGTIKRLGGKQIQKILLDDWADDIEMPESEGGLRVKSRSGDEFPESLRQLSSSTNATPSPSKAQKVKATNEVPASLRQLSTSGSFPPGSAKSNTMRAENRTPGSSRQPSITTNSLPILSKPQTGMSFIDRLHSAEKSRSSATKLNKYRDDDEFGDFPTIKVAKNRAPLKPSSINFSPTKRSMPKQMETFDDEDFDLPEGSELKLSTRKEPPKTPASQSGDPFELDWTDGSQASYGTSFGGTTRRTGRSNRSSSFSALSPSVFSPSMSSCFTAESEDEGLEGLVLPDGPIKFEEALRKRLETASPDKVEELPKLEPSTEEKIETPASLKEDFFEDIDIGDGNVFQQGKLTLNRNVQVKAKRLTSPKRTAMTLTFTNKPVAPITRIPKPLGQHGPRSKLDTVPETAGAFHALRRTASRIGGHSNQSSITSIPTLTAATCPPSPGPSTPSRRGLNKVPSRDFIRAESTTTSAQLLKSKRSMPLLNSRNQPSPSRSQPMFPRPSSRTDKVGRSGPPSRPKTPVERVDSSLANTRKPPTPFIPAGNAHASRHHVTTKTSRIFHRPTSSDSNSNENAALTNRPLSRLSKPHHRPTTPSRRDVAPEPLARAAASTHKLAKPLRRRAYGDGNELDVFDDLPTSASIESKYVKPRTVTKKDLSKANVNGLYSQPNQSATSIARAEPRTPLSPQRSDVNQVPRFAQGTTASLARKQRAGAISPQALRHPPSITQAIPQVIPQASENASRLSTTWKSQVATKPHASPRHGTKRSSKAQQKPHLIRNLGNTFTVAAGMEFNAEELRWEGNKDHALECFDDLHHSPKHSISTPSSKPALIANVGSSKGVQVVGGMVFDPQRMCWLKIGQDASRGRSQSGAASFTTDDDEDPFAGLDDLEDDAKSKVNVGAGGAGAVRDAGSDDDWVVGEEFDVGPGFVKRQEMEEAKWQRRLVGWKGLVRGKGEEREARKEEERRVFRALVDKMSAKKLLNF